MSMLTALFLGILAIILLCTLGVYVIEKIDEKFYEWENRNS